ncbi:MAG: SAM-dependent methyltransferase [Proteobacteria bacterium]|nr:SAM-dependent methyltransferase [Pseudomonadota bacterium]
MTLILVPNTLDLASAPVPLDAVLPRAAVHAAATITHWVVETPKVARAFLKRVDAVQPLAVPLQSLDVRELPRTRKGGTASVPETAWDDLLAPARAGKTVGLLSDAGLPGVADPGANLVATAHRHGVTVQVLAGPSSLTLALAASGLNGQRFAFEGYLPQDAGERGKRIIQLEMRSRQEGQTQLAIETPYRNPALLDALCRTLQPTTRLAVACGLTDERGWCRMGRVTDWRTRPLAMPVDLPAVFLWLA